MRPLLVCSSWQCPDCDTIFNPVFDLVVLTDGTNRIPSRIRWNQMVHD